MTKGDRRPTLGPLLCADLPAAVAQHRRLLPHGFLVALGERALRRYYVQFVHSPHGYARAARVDGELVGAIVGTLDYRAHSAWAAGQVASMTVAIAGGLLRHPGLIGPFLRTRLRRYVRAAAARVRCSRRSRAEPAAQPVTAVLAHVYVAPCARGLGLGGRLVDGFVAAARAAGAARGELATLAGDAGAGSFYARRGWQRGAKVHEVDGHLFETWQLPLAEPVPRPAAAGPAESSR